MATNSIEYMAKWRKENSDKVKAADKKYRDGHTKQRKAYALKYRDSGATISSQRKSRYGITTAEYEALISKQCGLCAVCNKPFGDKIPYIDHCHRTGKVRGLVHMICNTMMGHAKDNPEILERAAAYIRRFEEANDNCNHYEEAPIDGSNEEGTRGSVSEV